MNRPTDDDRTLLREFVEHGSQPAFTELVQRYAALVRGAATRQTRDAHLADDVTQAVFLMFAQRAARIGPRITIAGWLYNAARYAAANARRAAVRRLRYEQDAAKSMITAHTQSDSALADWSELEPHIDRAMSRLSARDRDAVLLRYFQNKPMNEVALALNVSDDAAKQRCLRAIDKLRRLLGPCASPAALPMLLSLHAATNAPQAHVLSLPSSIATTSSAPVASLAKGAFSMMIRAKLKFVAATSVAVLLIAGGTAGVAVALAPAGKTAAPTAARDSLPRGNVATHTAKAAWSDIVAADVLADASRFSSLLLLDPVESDLAATAVEAQADFQKALHVAFPTAPEWDSTVSPAAVRMFQRQTISNGLIEDTAGDDSTIHGPGGMDLYFKKIDGVWKLDLTRKPALENTPAMRMTVKARHQFSALFVKMTSSYRAAFAKLTADSYATAADAWKDIRASILPNEATARDPSKFQPVVVVQSEDYAAVRARFHTKLLKPISANPSDFKLSNLPATPPGARVIEYKSGDLALKAWISDSPSAATGKHPAVIVLHNLRGLQAEEWIAAQPFRDANFVLLMPSLRSEYGQAGVASFYYDEVEDVIAAAAFLRTQPDVDPDHIFLVGFGSGGPLALLAAEASPTFRAATSHFGIPDMALLAKLLPAADVAKFPFDPADPHELEVRSPLAYAQSLKCPARLYYGHTDAFLAPTNLRLADLAKEHHLDVSVTEIAGTDKAGIAESFRNAIAFFKAQQ